MTRVRLSYIRIRGIKSLSGDAQPLFVVDGVPIDNSVMTAEDPTAGVAAPNRAADINPNDIETVTILKGAAAAAVYGARAADGVILITTKSGHAGGTHYSLSSNYSFDDVDKSIPLQTDYAQGSGGVTAVCGGPGCRLSSSSYGALIPEGTPTYDHFGELFDTGQHARTTRCPRRAATTRRCSISPRAYNDQKGIIVGPNNAYQRTTVRLKASHHLFDRLTVGGNFSYVDGRGKFVQKGSNVSGLMLGRHAHDAGRSTTCRILDPTTQTQRSYRYPQPVLFDNTSGRGYDNPFFVIYRGSEHGRDQSRVRQPQYQLRRDRLAQDRLHPRRGLLQQPAARCAGAVVLIVFAGRDLPHRWKQSADRSQPDGDVEPHVLARTSAGTFTVGQNLNARRFHETDVNGQTLVAATPFNLQNTTSWIPTEFKSLVHSESYFGQATADIFNQLYLTAALRNDGFSTFGESDPRAWYPKASASWTFTNLLGKTDQKGLFSFGKLRAAYGETGKEPQVYSTKTVLVPGGQFATGFGDFLNATQQGNGALYSNSAFGALGAGLGALGNPNIKPEREKEFEGGVDLGFFDQKADVALTYYGKTPRT